jgi:hypothetical protein
LYDEMAESCGEEEIEEMESSGLSTKKELAVQS